MIALAVAMGIGRFAFTPLIPMMQAEGITDLTQASWLASANYAGYFIGSLVAVKWTFETKATVRLSLTSIAVSTFAMSIQGHFAGSVLLRALAGVTSALVMISISAWSLEQIARAARPALASLVYAGVGIGIVVVGAVCAWGASEGATSSFMWGAVGLLAAGATLVVWPHLSYRSPEAARAPFAPGRVRDVPQFYHFLGYQAAFGLGYIIPATFLPAMAREALHDPRLYGWIWPIFGLAAAASTAIAPVAKRILGQRRAWGVANYILGIGTLVPCFFPGLTGVTISSVAVGGTLLLITLFSFDEARMAAGPRAPQLIAAMLSTFSLGQIAGPLLVPIVLHAGGTISAAFVIAAAAPLWAGTSLVALHPQGSTQ